MISAGVCLGIAGALFCAFDRSIVANALWSIGNLLLLYTAYTSGNFETALMFGVYEVIALIGVIRYLSPRFTNVLKSRLFSVAKTNK